MASRLGHMPRTHHYDIAVTWTGDRGGGTRDYRTYGRDHEVTAAGRPVLLGSADPAFRGDPVRWNPELLLVVALSECHLLSYLSFCARQGVVVRRYADAATGRMTEEGSGGRFVEVVLHPEVEVAEESMVGTAEQLHATAHASCYIASSVNFPVRHEPTVTVA